MDNVQNCDSYVNTPSSQTCRSDETWDSVQHLFKGWRKSMSPVFRRSVSGPSGCALTSGQQSASPCHFNNMCAVSSLILWSTSHTKQYICNWIIYQVGWLSELLLVFASITETGFGYKNFTYFEMGPLAPTTHLKSSIDVGRWGMHIEMHSVTLKRKYHFANLGLYEIYYQNRF
jgi:hypothetical protein